MGISVIGAAASSGGGGGTNNFVLKTTAETTYVLDRTYTSGRYSLSFLDSDSTFDIYAIAEDGTYAGYTASTTLEVSADFAEVVVLGAASGTRISFTHLGVITQSVTSGDVATAGAFVGSVVTSSLPSADDTTVVNGGNFAANVAVSFIDQSSVETSAKTVVRSSSTQLIVTRPDAFSPDDSPYTVKVVNPGIPVPGGSSAHLLSNSVTAGTNPVWTTGTTVAYNVGAATSVTLLATDTEATDIDYSVVSGTLPAGLTLDGETGVISGTASGGASDGDVTAVTIRAIDAGGNFLDKAFNFTANSAPTWTTGATVYVSPNAAASLQLTADGGGGGGSLTYSIISGSLVSGLSMSSTGLITGNPGNTNGSSSTFTARATDEETLFVDRAFTINVAPPISGGTETTAGGYTYHTFTSSGTLLATSNKTLEYLVVAGGGGASSYGSGGGAGGLLTATGFTLTAGSHAVTVGAGGGTSVGENGGNSSVSTITTIGGGAGGSYSNGTPGDGGSGGGAGSITLGGAGTAGQGNRGGHGAGGVGGSGGGGASQIGQQSFGSSSAGWTGGNGGSGVEVWNTFYAGGGGGGTGNNLYNGYGGSGVGAGYQGAALANRGGGGCGMGHFGVESNYGGADGIVIVRYAV